MRSAIGLLVAVLAAGEDQAATVTAVPASGDAAHPATLGAARRSADERSIGWTIALPIATTSYPIPVTLVVFTDGRLLRIPIGQMIHAWAFTADGTGVLIVHGTTHGPYPRTVERRSLATGAIAQTFTEAVDPDNRALEHQDVPVWAEGVLEARAQ